MLSTIRCVPAMACCGSKYRPTDDRDVIGCYVKRTVDRKGFSPQQLCVSGSFSGGEDRGIVASSPPWQRTFRLRQKSSSEVRKVTSSDSAYNSAAESFSRNYRQHGNRPDMTSYDPTHGGLPESARRRIARSANDQTRSSHHSSTAHRHHTRQSRSTNIREVTRTRRTRRVKRTVNCDVIDRASSLPRKPMPLQLDVQTATVNRVELSSIRTSVHSQNRSKTQQQQQLRTIKEEVGPVLVAGDELEDMEDVTEVNAASNSINSLKTTNDQETDVETSSEDGNSEKDDWNDGKSDENNDNMNTKDNVEICNNKSTDEDSGQGNGSHTVRSTSETNSASIIPASDTDSHSTESNEMKYVAKTANKLAKGHDLSTEYDVTMNTCAIFKQVESSQKVEEWRQQCTIISRTLTSDHRHSDHCGDNSDTLWKMNGTDIQLSTFCASLLRSSADSDDDIVCPEHFTSTYEWLVGKDTSSNGVGNKTGAVITGKPTSSTSPMENIDDDHVLPPIVKTVDDIGSFTDVDIFSSSSASNFDDSSSSQCDGSVSSSNEEEPRVDDDDDASAERRQAVKIDVRERADIARMPAFGSASWDAYKGFSRSSHYSESSDSDETTSESSASSSSPVPKFITAIVRRFNTCRPQQSVAVFLPSSPEAVEFDESDDEDFDTSSSVDGDIPDGAVDYFVINSDRFEAFLSRDLRPPLSDIEEVSITSTSSTSSSCTSGSTPSDVPKTTPFGAREHDSELQRDRIVEPTSTSSTSAADGDDDDSVGRGKNLSPISFVEYEYSEILSMTNDRSTSSYTEALSWQWIGTPKIHDLSTRMFGKLVSNPISASSTSDNVRQSPELMTADSGAAVVDSWSYVIEPIIDWFANVRELTFLKLKC